jgi:FkbM family methyltransferase
VGANVGEEAHVYNELGINNVVWIEPNDNVYDKLVMNVAQYNHKYYKFCAGDQNKEEVVLHISNNAGQSSSILELGTHKFAHPEVKYTHDIKVPMFRIDSFFSSDGNKNDLNGIDFLNIDVQGAELMVLKGMGNILYNFKAAYLEVNKEELYTGCALVQEIDIYLLSFGFKRVETKWCGNTGWGDALYLKRF